MKPGMVPPISTQSLEDMPRGPVHGARASQSIDDGIEIPTRLGMPLRRAQELEGCLGEVSRRRGVLDEFPGDLAPGKQVRHGQVRDRDDAPADFVRDRKSVV